MIKVLVVEDSSTVRHFLREALTERHGFDIVGEAVDGAQAVDLCQRLRPDVITMDVVLPVMSGLTATEKIMASQPTPILVVCSASRQELFTTYDALAAGAVDVLEKPRGDASDGTWGARLRTAVKVVSRIRVVTRHRTPAAGAAPVAVAARTPQVQRRLVAVGASTGGPGAIVTLLRGVPAGFQVPLLYVQHLSANESFAQAFTGWLSEQTGHRVRYARGGESLLSVAGKVIMAPPDQHLTVRGGHLHLTSGPRRHSCRPSVDTLFESVAADVGAGATGILLTGMGRDGADGLLAMRRAGGHTYAQDQGSCVVYGMPKEAAAIGAAVEILPPDQIASSLTEKAGMANTVLIVDDSLTVRMDLHEAFEDGGFRTVLCSSGAGARAAFEAEQFDVAVLDVLLPDADGVDLLRELRAHPRHAGVTALLLSSEAEVSDRLRGLRHGADEYVGKPYDALAVVARSRELLQQGVTTSSARSVLVIDDSLTFREELRELLGSEGYEVQTAASGEEGLRVAAARPPDAIIVDGILPGIDGATVIRRVRLDATLRNVPCLLLTAADDYATELQILDAGADAFVRKQENLAVVLAKLAAVLRKSTTTPLPAAGPFHGQVKVLLVDTDRWFLGELAELLREEGYEPVAAPDADDALAMLAVQPAGCVVLGMDLPGVDSHALCSRIRSVPGLRDMPVIGVGTGDALLDCLAAGADDYVRRADGTGTLRAHIRAHIRRQQLHEQNRRIRDELVRRELEAAGERAARLVAETRAELVEELEWRNRELEAFSGSVSHDLRSPLQTILSFSELLLEEDSGIDPAELARRIHGAAQRMNALIDALLQLASANRGQIQRADVDLSELAADVVEEIRQRDPDREVATTVAPGMRASCDAELVRAVLVNLIGNAWKFTGRTLSPRIGIDSSGGDGVVFHVRDNGAGFPADRADQLFRPFGRLHDSSDFPGTGIGLTTVQRIVDRHGGRVWAQSEPGRGATFSFTLPAA